MIVELTGIPGAGKSTVISNFRSKLVSEKYIFDIPEYLLSKSIFPSKGGFAFDFFLLGHVYLLSKPDWKLLSIVFSNVMRGRNTLFHKVNILRNTYKKLVIHNIIKYMDGVFFVDEGVWHIPFTTFVDAHTEIEEEQIKALFAFVPKIDVLLVIDAPDKVLLARVIRRGEKGHRRINFSSNKQLVSFMDKSRAVLTCIKSNTRHIEYTNVDEFIHVEQIFEKLEIYENSASIH